VPYLRDRKYPRETFPDMYEYRELRPRLLAKISRAYARNPKKQFANGGAITFRRSSVENVTLPPSFDCLITSPPYMNALDYGRDNRLRLWFIDPSFNMDIEAGFTGVAGLFVRAISGLADKVNVSLKNGGHCVFVVGEAVGQSCRAHPSEELCRVISERSPDLRLVTMLTDNIPDVRRSRREARGVKREHILVFRRS
jgi:hypothetical protein